MSSKSKRRVTVDTGNTVSEDSEKRKPSVFERLGPGAGQRKYSEYDSAEREKKCRPFLLTGECPYGATCKYKHVQLSRKSKTKEDDTSPENLRLKLKGGESARSGEKHRDSDTESHDMPGRAGGRSRRDKEGEAGDRASGHSRRDKETKMKSQVVVKKSGNQDSEDSADDSESNWLNSLDYKKELELEQERQLLQRQLSQLAEAEDEVENITIQKKVPVPQSGSDSSPDRTRSGKPPASPHDKRSTSPPGRAKKEKKKHRTKSPPEMPAKDRKLSPSATEKPREHRKKHEAEEESHKKHKKKKEKRRSVSPPLPPPEVKAKKKDKVVEESDAPASRSHAESIPLSRQRSQSHTKRARSSSSDSSASPPRSKDSKEKAKGKGRKKKNRGGKGDAGSESDDSPAKSKKWLSPLKKTLKLKKVKPTGSVSDLKDEEERSKRRSASPRHADNQDLLAEDPMPPSRSHDSKRDWEAARPRGRSLEKRDKKHKGKRSESPAVLASDRAVRRGSRGRDVSFERKGRHGESPAVQGERGGSGKRGEGSRDPSYDRRKWEQDRDRKGGGDDRQKRGGSPPARQPEMYSPSQLDRDSPAADSSSRAHVRGEAGRDDDRRGQGRDARRADKADPRAQTPPRPERAGQDRYSRRDGDNFDQYGQDRGRFEAERGRGDSREGRGQEAGDRDQRGHRAEQFDRGVPARERGGRTDLPFDRRESMRQAGGRDGRDSSRDNEGRDRSRDAPRDRGDNHDARDREGRGPMSEGGKFGGSNFGGEGQRRGRQWEAGSRGGEWGGDRGDTARDLSAGRLEERAGHVFREDSRDAGRGGDRRGRDLQVDSRLDRGDGRLERGDSRSERGDSRLDRSDSRPDRGDGRTDRGDGRLERGADRMERGVDRVERGDRSLDRGDARLDRGDGRLDRGDARQERGDGRLDRQRGDQAVGGMDQRGSRQAQGRGGVPGSSDARGGMRGMGNRSPVDNRGSFEFDRRGGGARDVPADMGRGVRPGEREGRMDRDRDREPPGPPPRDRFEPSPSEFRRDDRGYRDDLPEVGAMRDRHGEGRFMEPDVRDPQQRGGRRFDDVRDDRMPDDRQARDRMLPRHGGGVGGGMYDYDRPPGPEVRAQDLPPSQRRGPLLPTPVEEPPPRRGGRGDLYDRELPRAGRDGARDIRDDRGGRRDQREAEFAPDLGPRDDRGRREPRDADFPPEFRQGGRDFPRDVPRDPLWGRDGGRDARDLGRDARDMPARRGRGTPGEELPPDMMDRGHDRGRSDSQRRDRDRSPRREVDKPKDSLPPDLDPGKRHMDKRDDGERGDRGREVAGKLETSDARSTRSADDLRESGSQRLKEKAAEGPGKASSLRGARDRDSQSDGKRSPGYSRGQERSPLPFSERRQPAKRTRSLSPKPRRSTPLTDRAPPGSDSGRSPAHAHSPSRRSAEVPLSPQTKNDRRARSRTPVGVKRKLDEELRSPSITRARDDAKSPAPKRPREESRSPGRRGSRHPSPAGSHHSRGSHSSSLEPRKRPGSAHRDGDGRFFGHGRDRDSPASWRDRDPATKGEKPGEGSKGDLDRGDLSRKRGRSPPRPPGRGSDSAEKGRKRWRGDGTWSDTDGDTTDKENARQKSAGEQGRLGDTPGNSADSLRTDTTKTPPGPPPTAETAKSARSARDESFGSRGNEEWPIQDVNSRSEPRPGAPAEGDSKADESGNHDNADDSKDAGLGNMLDDYEKISSDESDFDPDEEEKQSQNIVSVLDIDWASLAKEATPKQTTGSLLKRFHPATIFSEIGISRSLAGPALFDKVKALCEEGVKVSEGEEKGENKDQADSTTAKEESGTKSAAVAAKLDTSLQSDVPVMHMAAVRHKRERANLLRNLGPFRRALCARRDLEIRRQLCKVDKVYEHPAVFPAHVMDTDLCKLSIQLFRQGRDFVDRKDSECDSKMDLTV